MSWEVILTDRAEEAFLSLSETARFFNVSERTIHRWIHEGRIPVYKPGHAYRFRRSDLEEFLAAREVRPKVEAPPEELEPSLNDALEDQRREAVYGPWLEFVNRYADRWEARIAVGAFDLGSLEEFDRTTDDLLETLGTLARQEKREQPAEYPYTFGPITGETLRRVFDLYEPMLAAAAEKFPAQVLGDELEPLRRKRDERLRAQRRGA